MIKILSTNNLNKAEIIKQMLEENNIDVVILNKQDSSYLMFGDIEIYIKKEQEQQAKNLLTDTSNEGYL
tara:strand:+ start:348 stop:554 length:207 start_codon:yes stop_codon:yes gene_type:complete